MSYDWLMNTDFRMGSFSFALDFDVVEERLRVYDRHTTPSNPLDCFSIVVIIIVMQLATHTVEFTLAIEYHNLQ